MEKQYNNGPNNTDIKGYRVVKVSGMFVYFEESRCKTSFNLRKSAGCFLLRVSSNAH